MPANYSTDPNAWVAENYGPGYSADGGVKKVMGGKNGITMTHTRSTPETHPWLYMNSDQADTNGIIYGDSATRTDTGYEGGRMASPSERQASYDSNNYYRNGGQGLDPALMQGMTQYGTRGKDFSNQYGTYTAQHATIDQARNRAGLDPWMEQASRFSGRNQQGAPTNYQNQSGVWGNRGPGFQGGQVGLNSPLSSALRQGQQPPRGGVRPPTTPVGTQPPPSGGNKPPGNFIGLPKQPFGSSTQSRPQGAPNWWQQMQQRMPGQAMGGQGMGPTVTGSTPSPYQTPTGKQTGPLPTGPYNGKPSTTPQPTEQFFNQDTSTIAPQAPNQPISPQANGGGDFMRTPLDPNGGMTIGTPPSAAGGMGGYGTGTTPQPRPIGGGMAPPEGLPANGYPGGMGGNLSGMGAGGGSQLSGGSQIYTHGGGKQYGQQAGGGMASTGTADLMASMGLAGPTQATQQQSYGGPQMAGRLQMQSPPINPSQMSTDAALATSAALRRG